MSAGNDQWMIKVLSAVKMGILAKSIMFNTLVYKDSYGIENATISKFIRGVLLSNE